MATMHRPGGVIAIMFGRSSPFARENENENGEPTRDDEVDRDDADACDAHVISSFIKAMHQHRSDGVKAVRELASCLDQMADAFEQRDNDALEDAAADAHAALGKLHLDEDGED